MALSKTITRPKAHELDRVWPDAYLFISKLVYTKPEAIITLALCEQQGANPFDYMEFLFTPLAQDESANFVKQAYEYLKTLPEFSDAVDC